MYDIYISHHLNADGTATIETEELLYSIPISDSNSDRAVIDPVVSCEMGKSGSFEFSIPPFHPFYNRFQQMKTIMRVNYDGDNIFRGRVLTIDTNRMNGMKRIHLEGDLVFLADSYQEAVADGERPKTTINAYLQQVIFQHNTQMDVAGSVYKKMVLGEVPGQYSASVDDAQKITVSDTEFGSGSWQKTQDALGELTKSYGGYFRTRYENGVCYLDWLETYFNKTANTQPLKVTYNIISLNDNSEVDNLFTVLIPIGNDKSKKIYIDEYKEDVHGHNKSITVPMVAAYLRSQGRTAEMNKGFHTESDYVNAISKYGIIYKVQEFQDADTKEKLFNEAVKWVVNNYNGGITSFSLSALDLHHISRNFEQKLLVGEQVNVIYPDMSRHTDGDTPFETRPITLLSGKYNLHHPEKNDYTLGIPNSLLSKSGNRHNKKTKNDAVSSNNFRSNETNNTQDINDLKEAAEIFVISKTFNNEDYQKLVKEDPAKANAALKVTTALVHNVYKDAEDKSIWVYTSSKKTSADYDSVYRASNGTTWKIVSINPTKLKMQPINSSSTLPSSGTLTWVSGGTNHDEIVYYRNESAAVEKIAKTTTMVIDGITGKFEIGQPINPDYQWTDEQIDTINSMNRSIVLDATSQKISLKDRLEYESHQFPLPSPKERLLMKIDNAKNSGSLQVWNDKRTQDDNAPESASIIGASGTVASMVTSVGIDGTATKPTILQKGIESLAQMYKPSEAGLPTALPTIGNYGAIGKMAGIDLSAGKDGTGNSDTAMLNGPDAKLSMLDPNNAGSTDPNDVLVELTGQEDGTGKFGKDESNGWRIKVNDKVTYTDKEGTQHTLSPGFVTAEDFALFKEGIPSIPSFKTKLAVIDTALIDVAYISDLTAITAFIQDLQGETAKINRITAKNITAQTKLSAPSGISSSNYVYRGQNLENDLEDCFNDAEMSEENGVITLTLKRAKYTEVRGTGAKTVSFNMAATEFYQKAIAAAKSSVMPTAIAWDGTNRYFESHNPYNRDNFVKEEVQLVCDTSETSDPIYYASMQSRVYGSETPWNNRIRKTLAIADVDNNNVRLRFDGADTSLVYEHGQYTAGESAGKKLVMPTAIAWDGTNRYFESHNLYNRDNSVKEEVQLVCDTSGTSNPIYYASMQSRVYESETPWNNRIRKTLAITDVDNNNVRLRFDGADTSLVYKHGQYTAGWGVARTSTGDFPTSTNTYVSSITVKRPSSTVGGTADSYTYGLHTEGRTLIQLKYNDQTVVAQISNPYYYTTLEYNDYGETQFIAGKDSVNHDPVVSLSYVGREETSYPPISGLNLGSASQREITSFWCVAQAQCKDGDIVQATNNFRFSVNASQVYNNGYDKATSLMYFDNPGSSKTYMEIHYPESSDRTSSTGIIGYFHLVQSGNTVYLVYSSSTSTPSSSSAESEKRAQLSVSTPSHSPTAYHNTVWKTTNSLMDLLDRMGKDQSEVSAFISSSQLARNTWYGFCAQCGSSKKYYYFHTS